MSFISDIFSSIFGGGKDVKAIQAATAQQTAAVNRAIAEQRAAEERALEQFTPFREAGQVGLDRYMDLFTDPEAQRAAVMDSPFYQALAEDAQNRLFGQQAARGTMFSGGTAETLQKAMALLGTDLLNTEFGRASDLASMGGQAATNIANLNIGGGATRGGLQQTIGDVEAANILGERRARNQAATNLLNLGASIATTPVGGKLADIGRNLFGGGSSNPYQVANPSIRPWQEMFQTPSPYTGFGPIPLLDPMTWRNRDVDPAYQRGGSYIANPSYQQRLDGVRLYPTANRNFQPSINQSAYTTPYPFSATNFGTPIF